MQDEVNEKVVALSIKTSKLTAEVLQKAMKAVLCRALPDRGQEEVYRVRRVLCFKV